MQIYFDILYVISDAMVILRVHAIDKKGTIVL